MTTKKEVHTVIDFRSMKILSTPSLGYSAIPGALEIVTLLSIDSRTLSYQLKKQKRQCLPPNYVTILKSAGSFIPKGTEGQIQQQQCGAFLLILISVFMRKCHFKFFF